VAARGLIMNAEEIVLDLLYGRWRSQTLHAGVELGVFDATSPEPKLAVDIAGELRLDAALGYRLLRALAALRLLREHDGRKFSLEPAGEILRIDHPQSLRDAVLLREGPEHTAIWKHLPDMIRDGRQNAFLREYGTTAFDHATRKRSYGDAFNAGMSSQSHLQTAWTLDAMGRLDLSSIGRLCDVGGGHGHLLCHLLDRYRHLEGIVLDRPGVADKQASPWAARLGVADRCTFVEGDMFVVVPPADADTLKLILHDWNDEECVRIFRNLRRRATGAGRVFIIEHVIAAAAASDYAALFDMHMMCWGSGRERSEGEYRELLEASGWRHVGTAFPIHGAIAVVEGVPGSPA
jgi:hypothetical protein